MRRYPPTTPNRERSAIGESFLQAATFVGRQTELAQLTAAFNAVKQGKGSAWLVGGEKRAR